jgi:3-deoxy-D-manno-octulosonate 8-phosphate phosphatase (KDO 8-P phosphatase)
MKAKIQLLVMDVDGVLTNGSVTYNPLGEEIKSFHVRDGYGIKMLHEAGVQTAIISGRQSAALNYRAKEMQIKHVYTGVSDKLPTLKKISTDTGIALEHIAYVGDDIPDLECMMAVAYPITVANGDSHLKKIALWITKKSGGDGAVREICDWILQDD